ncbi:hypothetical protein BKA93DRAFT_62289 [Sparassis latifolia]
MLRAVKELPSPPHGLELWQRTSDVYQVLFPIGISCFAALRLRYTYIVCEFSSISDLLPTRTSPDGRHVTAVTVLRLLYLAPKFSGVEKRAIPFLKSRRGYTWVRGRETLSATREEHQQRWLATKAVYSESKLMHLYTSLGSPCQPLREHAHLQVWVAPQWL